MIGSGICICLNRIHAPPIVAPEAHFGAIVPAAEV
jgi:hypothetical protein